MMERPPIVQFLAIAERLGLTDAELAVLSRLSAHTIRLMRATGEAPKRRSCQARIKAFLAANGRATRRQDLRLAA